ncbi:MULTISPECIES: MmoB/DmpM family protein [Pyrobaculum]|uniref:Toluene monooxygenase n=2 Tax=Pyrobaculum TaxID=2276 RepID=A0A371R239_9CREN|nr:MULTISPECIES: MmoB/DmpM family protein [Pyrobaculum]ABP50138.1 toluene 4-monooxygenase protein D [Pyrobaculum arsenaticum DSM 13514]RFA97592.1 toluene monooxygenase [Pyrobaculum aerophilum]RFA99347.1 toluene monooxygenase [Pyrobaculum aerophilum]
MSIALAEWAPELEKYLIDDSKIPKDVVGPVFMKTELAIYAVEAIARDNPDTFVGILDRGLYVRVVGNRRLVLNSSTLVELAGRPVRFPGEVEVIMSAFAGKIRVTGERIEWYLEL